MRLGRERLLLVPADVVLVFDAHGWHAEALPRDVDIEALCDAQDLEDAAWLAERAVAPCARLRAPVKRPGRHRRRRRK